MPLIITYFIDNLFSRKLLIIPLKPINPVNNIDIQFRIIKNIFIPAVNIVKRFIKPNKNINTYAGICINFINIFVNNIFCEYFFLTMLLINKIIEQINEKMKIINNVNKTYKALF